MTSNEPPRLNPGERKILTILRDLGGNAGKLEDTGCVMIDGYAVPASLETWIKFVANGLVAGEYGQLILTELGREACLPQDEAFSPRELRQLHQIRSAKTRTP